MNCAHCNALLGDVRYVFALQGHGMEYSRPGETPSEQAVLTSRVITTLARYCSSACCKQQLPDRLERLALPATLQHNRVLGGPICPCGKCGTPVVMTQPHVAVIKGKVLVEPDGEEGVPVWFDILTVLCDGCDGAQAREMVDYLHGLTDETRLEHMMFSELSERAEPI